MYRYLLLSSVTVKMDYKENMENSRYEPKIIMSLNTYNKNVDII